MLTPDEQKALVAERLREARILAGLSQGQIAKIMKWHRPTISQIEAGERNVSVVEATQLAGHYEVSVTWLLGIKPERGEEDPRTKLAARELGKLQEQDLDRLLKILKALRSEEDSS